MQAVTTIELAPANEEMTQIKEATPSQKGIDAQGWVSVQWPGLSRDGAACPRSSNGPTTRYGVNGSQVHTPICHIVVREQTLSQQLDHLLLNAILQDHS